MADPSRHVHERRQPSGLEVRQLRAFVALVEHGGMTAAAQALGLAQSTVSEAVAALERALGTPVTLRRRGAHDIVLTAAGQALLPHARGVLAGIDAAHVAVVESTTSAHATLDIVANESVSTYALSSVLQELRRRWPATRFSVTVASCTGVRAGVIDGEFDIGIALVTREEAARAPATLAAERVVIAPDVPLLVFGAPAHPLARRAHAPTPLDGLAPYPMFVCDSAGDFHALVVSYFSRDGLPVPGLVAAGSVEGVKRGAFADARALGILPAYAVAEELQSGRLAAIGVQPGPPVMCLQALLSRSRPRHPATDLVIDGVRHFMDAALPRRALRA